MPHMNHMLNCWYFFKLSKVMEKYLLSIFNSSLFFSDCRWKHRCLIKKKKSYLFMHDGSKGANQLNTFWEACLQRKIQPKPLPFICVIFWRLKANLQKAWNRLWWYQHHVRLKECVFWNVTNTGKLQQTEEKILLLKKTIRICLVKEYFDSQ